MIVRRWFRFAVGAMLLSGALVVPSGATLAADAVDQSYIATGTSDFVSGTLLQAQVLTAGVTGSLNRVDVQVARFDGSGPLTVAIETVAAGAPTGTVLASASVAADAVAADGSFRLLSVALPGRLVTAGTEYAIVLAARSASNDAAWLWRTTRSGAYAGGSAAQGNATTNVWTILGQSDRTFTTYVDSTPCAGGFFSETGFGPCTPADPGYFATGPGATAQTACDPGTFASDAASATCTLAPVGSYVDTAGATA